MVISKCENNSTLLWDEDLIRRYDLSGPRYTSYPTAPQFNEQFSFSDWQSAMLRSNTRHNPLSLYFHIPFCDTVCYYCGCNKIITANKQHATPYLEALHKEIIMQAEYVDKSRPVHQLHWGGGTPTYINDQQMSELMTVTRQHFNLLTDDSGEYSIEIHPQSVTPARMQHIRSLGFNRVSLGIQDFNPEVQTAVNRFNSKEEVEALINSSRKLGFHSISVDLIYGLPKQTIKSFTATLDSVIELRPDRLSLFNYAHMPHIFKVQKQINVSDLPEPQEKLHMFHNSIDQLLAAGYVYIGMDHFALPTDDLSIAQQQGKLQRNFQGYATHGNCDLLAFGVSAINSLDNVFAQNHKDSTSYIKAINDNRLPLNKGLTLNRDDLIRRSVINQLICHFTLDFSAIEKSWGIVFTTYFADELMAFHDLVADGLVSINADKIQISNTGRLLIRRICMVFDAYLQQQASCESRARAQYSRII